MNTIYNIDFNEPIIKSFLDTDLYKYTMMQVAFHQYPDAIVEYEFKCRNEDIDLTPYMGEIRRQIEMLEHLRFQYSELNYMKSIPFIKDSFVDFLALFKFDTRQIKVYIDNNKKLAISVRGPWWQTILYEVFVLSIVNEVYFRNQIKDFSLREKSDLFEEGRNRLRDKLALLKDKDLKDFKFMEFGTRRRFGREWQEEVYDYILKTCPEHVLGTSNLYLAKETGTKPMGTMAHEYLQAHQALGVRLVDSQKAALESWIKEYRGDLGIALTDVINMDSFLKDFDLMFSKLFDGIRHDSGDPFVWGNKAIDHYNKLGIDPKSKILVFSDGLNFPKAIEIYRKFNNEIKTSYGIGTNITNDLGLKALNIVMKMTICNGQDTAKISDEPGKGMCKNKEYENYLISVFNNKPALNYNRW